MAQLLMSKNDIDGAESELARARAIDPNDVSMLRLSGEVLLGKGDVPGAIREFGDVLTAHPNDVPTLLERAHAFLDENRLADAQRDLDKAGKLAPNNIGVPFLAALLDLKKGNLSAADDKLTGISQYFNTFPAGYYLEGTVQYALKEYAGAEANLSKYVARNPSFSPARRMLAEMAMRRHDYKGAIDILTPVVSATTPDVAAIGILARAYVATGRRNEAVELLQKAAQAKPDDSISQTSLALIRMQIGQTKEGMAELEKLANTETGAAAAAPILIVTDLRAGKTSAAAAEAEALLKRDNKDVVARNLLGLARMNEHDYEGAAKAFGDIVQQNPNLVQVQRNLAEAYIAMKRVDDAKKLLQGILQEQPNDLPSMLMLAGMDIGAKQYADADALLQKAQRVSPDDPSPGIERIRIWAAQKDWNKAKLVARDLEGQFPANASVIDVVAQMRAASGDVAGAMEEYRQLTEAHPNFAEAFASYGSLQARNNDVPGARASLEKAIELSPPQSPIAYMTALVDLDYRTGGLTPALATAQSFGPKYPIESIVVQANLLATAKRVDDAIALLKKAMTTQADPHIVLRLAELIYQEKKPQEAEAMLQRWLKDHGSNQAGRVLLATMFISQGDYDDAQKQYELVYKDDPSDAIVLNNLAWLYARKGDARARGMAEQGFQLAPTAKDADLLGWLMVKGGQAKAGVRYLRWAAELEPKDMSVQYHLAYGLKASGETDQARTLLERLVNSDAVFDEKNDARRLLQELQHG